jgi:hypothetical protein
VRKRIIARSYGRTSLRLVVLFAAVAALSAVAAMAASGKSTAGGKQFTLYSIATSEQYVNNADDRLRGKGNNPFGNFHDNSPTTKQAKGPFPGDEAIFTFKVYSDANRRDAVGTATFTCQYNFNDNVFCDAVYRLPAGTLYGAGGFSFAAASFSLAITGGTSRYAGLAGSLVSSPAPAHAQRLAFSL